jgi:hypothetical protein
MSLIPIENERRLASPAEAEALFRALDQTRVSVRGLHTTDPTRFAHVVDALEPKHDHTLSFEGGTLTTAAHEALDALATAGFQYLDLRTAEASLRIWPALYSWVHGNGDKLETKDIPTALAAFRGLTGERVNRGFINGVLAETKPLLLRFLGQLGTRVDAVLSLDVAAARALTEIYAGERLDWQADGILVDFPEGRVHGFLVSPNVGETHRAGWQQRIVKALHRAGLA